jgi:hypothetical protein
MSRRILAKAGFALGLVLAPGPAFAQESAGVDDRPFDRDCMDDYGRDLCDAGQWARIVSSFGLEPADAERAQGWRGVRVFTVNGYSQDMPMISVLSRGEGAYGLPRESVLEIRGPAEGGGLTLGRDAWFGLQGAAAGLQNLVAEATERQSGAQSAGQAVQQEGRPTEEDEILICLHAWVTVTESLTDTGVLRRIRNACGDDPLFKASYDLAAQALRGFPHCNHLDPANYRNESTQLSACLILTGEDRVAAAEVLSIADGARSGGFAEHFAPEIRWLGSAGDVLSGLDAVEARFSELFDSAHFVVEHVVGGADGVVVSGTFARYVGDGIRETTAVRQSWRRRGDRWMLVELAPEPTRRVQLSDN